jgi:hypothetical protein
LKLGASWSKCLIPDPLASKPALFATSNKAGDVCVWAYTDSFEYKTQVTPHKSFVNLIEWTGWKKLNDTTYIAYIASACTDGTVAISSVQIELSVDPESKISKIQDTKMKVLHVWFEDNNRSVTTLIKIYDDLEKGIIKIAVSKGITVQIICLSVKKDNTVVPKKDWQVFILESSGLGLSSGSWIDNTTVFKGYTIEGEYVYLKVDSEGKIEYDKEMSIMQSAKLVKKYKQQWMEEQMKADDDSIIAASDAHPFLWGTCDAPNQIFTAIFFS